MDIGQVVQVHDAHAPELRARIVDRLIADGLQPRRRAAAELAVHEALCNALEHGHRGASEPPIEVELRRLHADRVVVHVVDSALGGPWSPPADTGTDERSTAAATDRTGQRGRGLGLMRAGCDELRVTSEPGATRVALTFDCARHPVPGVGANGLER
jgi:anti-sigma regulatory factor (Ser/Thr protein kinase)